MCCSHPGSVAVPIMYKTCTCAGQVGDYNWVPYPACRSCLSEDQPWTEVSGDATVFSLVLTRRSHLIMLQCRHICPFMHCLRLTLVLAY